MISAKKITVIVFLGILTIFILIGIFQKKSLESNFIVTSGYIYEFGNSKNSGETIFFKFKFSVNGRTYYGNSGITCARKNRIKFESWTKNKEVQVVYDKPNPNNSELLLTIEDYKRFNIAVADKYKAQVKFIEKLCNGN